MNSKSLRLKTLKGAKATCVVEVLISAATSMKTTSKRPKKTTTLLEIGNHSNGVRGSRDALCKKDTGLTGGESAAFFWAWSSSRRKQMDKVSESIYTSSSLVIPMAEVQHIEKLKRSDGKGGMVPNGLFLITRMTTWSQEMDMWENPIVVPPDESEAFLKAWCFYRNELEASSPSCYGAKSVAAEK